MKLYTPRPRGGAKLPSLVETDLGQVKLSAGRVLDFDIESRPLGWYGGDWVHQEPTAICTAWIVDGEPEDLEVILLDRRTGSARRMLKRFLERYEAAGMVTGHYIRGFDLPQLNAAMLENDLPPLQEKLTHDTKNDLIRFQGLSKSQENLGSILGIPAPKVAMSQADWREVNRLTERGRELVRERVEGDVRQHVQMYGILKERGFLGPPKLWSPGEGRSAKYVP